MTHEHAKIRVKCRALQKLGWKQTDGQTGGHDQIYCLPC